MVPSEQAELTSFLRRQPKAIGRNIALVIPAANDYCIEPFN